MTTDLIEKARAEAAEASELLDEVEGWILCHENELVIWVRKLATRVNALADEVERLKGDLAVTNTGGLKLLYDIRRELGFNEYFPLTHLDTKARDVKARAERLEEVVKLFQEGDPEVHVALAAASPFADVDVMAMIGALEKASRRFHEYEAGHAEKGTVDGDKKARRNAEMAELIDTALSTVPAALRGSGS